MLEESNTNLIWKDWTDQESALQEIVTEADWVNDWLAAAENEFVKLTDYDTEDRLEDEEDEDWL